jgi:mannose/fructose/N-acetylgalactosamine-specific phosphotransferase system component IIC
VKKHEAVEGIERAGETINEVNARIWTVALNPTQYGALQSLASIVAIPVLSMASVGQLVTHAVVRQIPDNVVEEITSFGKSSD